MKSVLGGGFRYGEQRKTPAPVSSGQFLISSENREKILVLGFLCKESFCDFNGVVLRVVKFDYSSRRLR